MLTIYSVGRGTGPLEDRDCVVLVGTMQDIKACADLWGQRVALVPADKDGKPLRQEARL